jgi:hypothetical protein
MWEYVHREKLSQKRELIAAEQSRPDIVRRRTQWCKYRSRIDPAGWSSSTRPGLKPHGAAARMVAARAAIQGQSTAFGHCQTLTFAAPRSCHRPMTYGPINGESFRVYIESVLVPARRPGDFHAAGSEAPLPTQIFSRLEPDRAVLLQAEHWRVKPPDDLPMRSVTPSAKSSTSQQPSVQTTSKTLDMNKPNLIPL